MHCVRYISDDGAGAGALDTDPNEVLRSAIKTTIENKKSCTTEILPTDIMRVNTSALFCFVFFSRYGLAVRVHADFPTE